MTAVQWHRVLWRGDESCVKGMTCDMCDSLEGAVVRDRDLTPDIWVKCPRGGLNVHEMVECP
jgi:hypothetical protein